MFLRCEHPLEFLARFKANQGHSTFRRPSCGWEKKTPASSCIAAPVRSTVQDVHSVLTFVCKGGTGQMIQALKEDKIDVVGQPYHPNWPG